MLKNFDVDNEVRFFIVIVIIIIFSEKNLSQLNQIIYIGSSSGIIWTWFRSSHRRRSVKESVLRNFAKFTGKHLCQSIFLNKIAGLIFLNKVAGLRLVQVFSCEFYEISKNAFFIEHLWATAVDDLKLKVKYYFERDFTQGTNTCSEVQIILKTNLISWHHFFSIWVFFHNYSRITGLQGKGEGISLTPHYHFHPLHRYLDISRAVITESPTLHIDSSRTRAGNLWFLGASR